MIDHQLPEEAYLPSPPTIAVKILEAMKKVTGSAEELAAIISRDPALTSRILKVANSPVYGAKGKVASIQRALTLLGNDVVKNISLSFVIMDNFRRTSLQDFDMDLFWRRSVIAATSAQEIAKLIQLKDADIFFAGLLQDVGELVFHMHRLSSLESCSPQRQNAEKVKMDSENGSPEQWLLLGAQLLKKWGLPLKIYLPILHRGKPSQAPAPYRAAAQVLQWSHQVACAYADRTQARHCMEISKRLHEQTQLSEKEIMAAMDNIAHEVQEILSTFDLQGPPVETFSELLQKANCELWKINMSYEQLVKELIKEKKKIEKLARQLRAANKKLQLQAATDSLTGLYNHGFFQELLEREFHRAIRYGKKFSLVLMDLDFFKQINDRHGHQTGDLVLKKVGKLLRETLRASDIAARYGGEEFAVILPESTATGGALMAERIRVLIQNTPFDVNESRFSVTASFGVCSFDPELSSIRKKSDLVALADKALYRAKNTGRNKVCVARGPANPSQTDASPLAAKAAC